MTGEHLSPDVQEFIRLLYQKGVRYLVVGGEAVIHHGYPRLTGDIDLYYEQTASNCRRLFEALAEFWGSPIPAVGSVEDLLDPDVVVQFGRPPNRIDLISQLGAVEFRRAWRHRVTETMRLRSGRVSVYFIGLAELIDNKRDAGRHKDLDDVEHLSALKGRGDGARQKPVVRRTRSIRKKRSSL